jgi:hypothetical protein
VDGTDEEQFGELLQTLESMVVRVLSSAAELSLHIITYE